MKTTTADIFAKTETEYATIDKALAKTRKLFAQLKEMEENGLRNTTEWANIFAKYREVFKKANGYFPHWAR